MLSALSVFVPTRLLFEGKPAKEGGRSEMLGKDEVEVVVTRDRSSERGE
jgi:hypothetical protein